MMIVIFSRNVDKIYFKLADTSRDPVTVTWVTTRAIGPA